MHNIIPADKGMHACMHACMHGCMCTDTHILNSMYSICPSLSHLIHRPQNRKKKKKKTCQHTAATAHILVPVETRSGLANKSPGSLALCLRVPRVSRLVPSVGRASLQLFPLGPLIAQSRYYLQTLDPKVGTICMLGALAIPHRVQSCACGVPRMRTYIAMNPTLNPKRP